MASNQLAVASASDVKPLHLGHNFGKPTEEQNKYFRFSLQCRDVCKEYQKVFTTKKSIQSEVKKRFKKVKNVKLGKSSHKQEKVLELCSMCMLKRNELSHCKLCSTLVCKYNTDQQCSTLDLMVYLHCDDQLKNDPQKSLWRDVTPAYRVRDVCMAIVGLKGCQIEPPTTHEILRICRECRAKMAAKQSLQYTIVKTPFPCDDRTYLWRPLTEIAVVLNNLQIYILEALPQFEDYVNSLDKRKTNRQQVQHIIARKQADLMSVFCYYVLVQQNFKQFSVKTDVDTQTIIWNFHQRSATFYYEQRPLLEASHDTLMKNPEVDLNYVQDVLCKDMLLHCERILKQSEEEVTSLHKEHNIQDDFTNILHDVLQVALEDEPGLQDSADSILDRLMTAPLQLIVPNRQLTTEMGTVHINDAITARCLVLIQQLIRDLSTLETSDSHLIRTKEKLQQACQGLKSNDKDSFVVIEPDDMYGYDSAVVENTYNFSKQQFHPEVTKAKRLRMRAKQNILQFLQKIRIINKDSPGRNAVVKYSIDNL